MAQANEELVNELTHIKQKAQESFERKEQEEQAQPNKKYRVRPIIILLTEEDGVAFTWFMRNKEKLYALGYRQINLEMNCDTTISYLRKSKEAFIKSQREFNATSQHFKTPEDLAMAFIQKNLTKHDAIVELVNCLECILQDKSWNYRFIDIKHKKMFFPDGTFRLPLEQLKPMREKSFATAISESSDQCQGGTITFIGNRHFTTYEKIKEINPNCAASAVFVDISALCHIKVPHNPKLEEYIKSSRMPTYKQCRKTYGDKVKACLPPKSFLTLDYSNRDPNMIQMLDTLFMKFIDPTVQKLAIAEAAAAGPGAAQQEAPVLQFTAASSSRAQSESSVASDLASSSSSSSSLSSLQPGSM